jgi:hypothetical protein
MRIQQAAVVEAILEKLSLQGEEPLLLRTITFSYDIAQPEVVSADLWQIT